MFFSVLYQKNIPQRAFVGQLLGAHIFGQIAQGLTVDQFHLVCPATAYHPPGFFHGQAQRLFATVIAELA